MKFNGIIHVKHLEQCLAYSKCTLLLQTFSKTCRIALTCPYCNPLMCSIGRWYKKVHNTSFKFPVEERTIVLEMQLNVTKKTNQLTLKDHVEKENAE